ncbi:MULTISPECIES: hypothetical protein [Actinopolyspora]|uniref:XRE family transcriptional regulator n=1 Tax=Actinopolyspora saharensis TaxID=995062 RepID=A0A1H0YTD9_9ACTN|nr:MULTISPECIES: hypothetical protein [Actinopolyspora]NHD19408.1 hypothetical protein [Actinopolyspora sp. BKK2]NHE78519.1 hypothetical protein [Actinopolyspora sp. BKK1]SDQ18492.1 hypothetical protein SAMN04489718_0666 [Actinopolyspora saharensis]
MADEGRAAFANRLYELMDEQVQDDGRPWSIPALARALTERGHPISRQHLHGVAKQKHVPTWDLVRALAELFGTTTDSFTGRGAGVDEELPVLLNRAGELDENGRAEVADFIRFLHQKRRRTGPGE